LDTVYRNIHRELIEQSKSGDSTAQTELYQLYSKAMYNIAYRISNNQEDAEDILQDAFVSAFNRLDSFRGDSSFGAWLKKIVVNKSINFIKKKRLDIDPLDEGTYEAHLDNPYDDDDLVMNVDRIRNAIQKLPDGYRVVFSLYLLEGYDHREIAQVLDISESTSKSQYNRAKKKIRELLNDTMYEAG